MNRPVHCSSVTLAFLTWLGWLAAGCHLTASGAQTAPPAAALADAQTIALNDANTVNAEFRLGAAGTMSVVFKFADGKTLTVKGAVNADTLTTNRFKSTAKSVPMADGWIEFKCVEYLGKDTRILYYCRPRLQRYTEAQQADLAKVWDTLPAASQCWVSMQVRAVAAGAEHEGVAAFLGPAGVLPPRLGAVRR